MKTKKRKVRATPDTAPVEADTKPKTVSGDPSRPALPDTVNPNGRAVGLRYYAYVFHPAESIDDEHVRAVAEALAGPHANIGDLWLKVGRKLIGVAGVKGFCVAWDQPTNGLTLWVDKGHGLKACGGIRCTDEWSEWMLPSGYPPAVEKRFSPPTEPPRLKEKKEVPQQEVEPVESKIGWAKKVEAVLSKKPQSLGRIKKAAGLGKDVKIMPHLEQLVKDGTLVKGESGYALAPKAKAKTTAELRRQSRNAALEAKKKKTKR